MYAYLIEFITEKLGKQKKVSCVLYFFRRKLIENLKIKLN